MTGPREYEPMVVHAAGCPDAPIGLMILPARAVAETFPHYRPHRCINTAYATANKGVVIVKGDYPAHDYGASSIIPADASRALCRVCRGTHSQDRVPVGGDGDGALALLRAQGWYGR